MWVLGSDGLPMSYPSMVPSMVSRQLEPEDADPEESVNHYPDAQPAPGPTQTETSERKQKETPPTSSVETTVVTKKIKAEGSGSRGCVRQADFDELTRSVIEETVSIYRA